jgi:hypothetical protein
MAVQSIENPRVHGKNLARATTKIGGAMIRDIPFRYACAWITVSIGDLTQGPPPKVLMTSDFDAEFFSPMDYGDLQKKAPHPDGAQRGASVRP